LSLTKVYFSDNCEAFGTTGQMRTRTQKKGDCEELIAFHRMVTGALDRRAIWTEALEVSRTVQPAG